MSTLTPEQPAKADVVDPRTLITPELFGRLTARIEADHYLPAEQAAAIMEQALGFLYTCARNPGVPLTPSPQVDLGWHTFLMYTREYAGFCEKVAPGWFIHHQPDEPETPEHGAAVARLGQTVDAMRAAGVNVLPDLWLLPAECSQCHQGCYDDPRPNGGDR
ncbi:glycine-rich domain-containing protein [Nonomuraea endophytica]|uniref:glycine-rich domain-containing protein n=1 Tax=Nonomuraea endophytica TaxID=714136 RepID=UPI0037C65C49